MNISLIIALAVAFIDLMGVGLVYPMFSSILFQQDSLVLPPLSSDALRGFWLGILLSAMPLAQFFSAPILGALSDLKGRKPVLIVTLLVSLVGYLLCAFGVRAQSLLLLLGGRLIVGIAAGNAAVAGAVIADISGTEEKGKNFGRLNMVSGMGFTIGPFLGGKLSESSWISSGGYDQPFFFAGIITFLNFLLLAQVLIKLREGPRGRSPSLNFMGTEIGQVV